RFEWNVGDLWAPAGVDRAAPGVVPNRRWFHARLRQGVSGDAAQAQMETIVRRRAAAHPDEYPDKFRVQVLTAVDYVVGRFRRVLYTLFAAVGLLLVIACCNVSNMLLGRGAARAREVGVRVALGAGRGRIVRQLLAESLVLACGGAVAGSALAFAGIAALALWMP